MNYSKNEIDEIKADYPVDTRIHLQYMEGEPQMTRGMRATVKMIDDAGQIHVVWDNGSTLALNLDCDIFTAGGLSPQPIFLILRNVVRQKKRLKKLCCKCDTW